MKALTLVAAVLLLGAPTTTMFARTVAPEGNPGTAPATPSASKHSSSESGECARRSLLHPGHFCIPPERYGGRGAAAGDGGKVPFD